MCHQSKYPSGHPCMDLNAHFSAISLAMSNCWQDLIPPSILSNECVFRQCWTFFPLFKLLWLWVTTNCWSFTLSLFAINFPAQSSKPPGVVPAFPRIWGYRVSVTGPQASWNIPSSRGDRYETVKNYNQLSKLYKCAKCREREEWLATTKSKLKR